MKFIRYTVILRVELTIWALVALSLPAYQAAAQVYGGTLTTEGLHHQYYQSAASRALGGLTIGDGDDLGLMFVNPTSIRSIEGLQLSLGGVRQYRDVRQEQQFAPVRYYPNLSLLLEGLTDQIPDPDPNLVGFTPADSVQRPFDDIQPRWSRSNTTDLPLHALLGAPFSLGGVTLIAGVGAVQYANLDHYYQNNNVLEPAVLSQRPLPTFRPTDDNPVTADWYQSIRSRSGSIQGYGAALAGHVERYDLTIGVSGLVLNGNSDDFEQRVERGTLTFLANEFRAESSGGRVTRSGTSEYSAQEFSVSATLSGRFASVGFVLRPPTTYTRTFQMNVEADTSALQNPEVIEGEDRLRVPWRGSAALLLQPQEKLSIGLEYEFRPYSSATFTSTVQNDFSPWESSSVFRLGTEYELASWLVVRGGIRGEAEVFVPEGSAVVDEPARYRVYSAGIGLNYFGIRWNITYQSAHLKYDDIWGSAVSRNWDRTQTLSTDITFTIPVMP